MWSLMEGIAKFDAKMGRSYLSKRQATRWRSLKRLHKQDKFTEHSKEMKRTKLRSRQNRKQMFSRQRKTTFRG